MSESPLQRTIAREAAAKILSQLEKKAIEGSEGEYHIQFSSTELFIIISLLEKYAGDETESGGPFRSGSVAGLDGTRLP